MTSYPIQFLPGRRKPAMVIHRVEPRLMAATAASLVTSLFLWAAPATAYPIYWPNQTFEEPDLRPPAPAVKRRVLRRGHPKPAQTPTEVTKPHGPLIIAISIEQQHLRIFDANGLFAESPVSTGMRGHSTPMGVFSVIQKSKWHRSNIYSGAPMPYMQRITWSGVALHAGVLPGYPASHGCIRMPMAFAIKLWSWSKLGARVVIAPGDVTPADISHPALITGVPDMPAAAAPSAVDSVVGKSDKAATTDTTAKPDAADRVRIADAEGALAAAEKLEPGLELKPETAPTLAPAAAAVPPAPASSPGKPDAATTESRPVDHGVDAAETPSVTSSQIAQTQTEVAGASPTNAAKDQSRASDTAKDASPKELPAKEAAPADVVAADLAPKVDPPAVVAPKRTGHIAVLISRKDSRLYVRQNFEPLFDVPVTIAQSDSPLGTHVFTARADTTDPTTYRWSVVSLPILPKRRDARAEDISPRRKRLVPTVETPAPSPSVSAAEALDRLTIPKDAMAKIAAALASGSSIIVSDQGLGGETGMGTDFIVLLR